MKKFIYTLTASCCEDSMDIFTASSLEEAHRLIRQFIPILLAECNKEIGPDGYRKFWADNLDHCCFTDNFETVMVKQDCRVWWRDSEPVWRDVEKKKWVSRTQLSDEVIFDHLCDELHERELDVFYNLFD